MIFNKEEVEILKFLLKREISDSHDEIKQVLEDDETPNQIYDTEKRVEELEYIINKIEKILKKLS